MVLAIAGGQWKTAAEIFDGMLPNQCKPDAVTYGTLISAFEKGGQWGSALHVSSSSHLWDTQPKHHYPGRGGGSVSCCIKHVGLAAGI